MILRACVTCGQTEIIPKESFLFWIVSGLETPTKDTSTSYNENDILGKLLELKVTIDPSTGKAKYLKELNSLGRRKPKPECPEPNPPKGIRIDRYIFRFLILIVEVILFDYLCRLHDRSVTKNIEENNGSGHKNRSRRVLILTKQLLL